VNPHQPATEHAQQTQEPKTMARAKVKTQQQPAAKNGDGADFGPKPQPVAAAPHNGPVSTKGSMAHEKITLSQLEGFLFKSADILRGKMDACSTSTILAGRRQLFCRLPPG
jgi:hypothetical protein